jgi:hypothetical protein
MDGLLVLDADFQLIVISDYSRRDNIMGEKSIHIPGL